MRLDQLITYFETSPAIRLLRADHAPFVLDFLFQQFKKPGRISMAASELVAALAEYRDSIHETHPDVLRDKPEQYLLAWCSGETRWIHRFLEAGRNEPAYQLTPHTEEVFLYLGRSLQRDLGFLGTESRLRLVISTLADLVAGASHDPDVRLAHLREERKRLDEEIEQIQGDGNVAARYAPAAVRERFSTAVTLLKELLADFRAVEERFREITRQVQKRQLDGKETRGAILEFALDSEDILKKDDEGASFYEFFRFILSPAQQEKLRDIIAELGRIEEIAMQTDGLTTVRRMVKSLIADAEKVMRTNQRLSATLRRLLDTRAAGDRKRLNQLLGEIRGLAAQLAEDPPGQLGVLVDVGVEITAPFSRTFWAPPGKFTAIEIVEHEVDDARRTELFGMLAQMHRLDWRTMRDQVREVTRQHGRAAPLSEVVKAFPPTAGVIEILGYIQIAADDGHVINRDRVEYILLTTQDAHNARTVTVPLVYFLPAMERADAAS